MKKIMMLFVAMLVLGLAAVGSAASKTGPTIPTGQKLAECYQDVWGNAQGQRTKVGVIYLNKAVTTYDDDIDYQLLTAIVEGIAPQDHIMVDATNCLDELGKIGINDLTMAERSDIIGVLRSQGLDYAVLVQVDPFQRKERMSMFRYTIEMTSDIMLKIVDVQDDKYLYTTKMVKMGKHGTAVAGVSNKATVAKCLDQVCPELTDLIAGRIPKG